MTTLALTLTLTLTALALATTDPNPHHRTKAHTTNPHTQPPPTANHAADIELFAACMSAGLTPATSTTITATTSNNPQWRAVATLLALGAPPPTAWAPMRTHPTLTQLADQATISATTGAPITQGLTRIAEHIRHQATTAATATAEKAGVLIAIPLAAFYLPAFFALGLAPTVISIASNMLP
ncbi:type II secretion system F family protein [Corynebacterium aquilae]|uniref:type II secretion system F family protein n=1 Tax=Corynebacterium aquilae TaxID=203263 RepID=UPI0009535FB2|nr:type II secretion system F family protein [Corynebacterium aquilae]